MISAESSAKDNSDLENNQNVDNVYDGVFNESPPRKKKKNCRLTKMVTVFSCKSCDRILTDSKKIVKKAAPEGFTCFRDVASDSVAMSSKVVIATQKKFFECSFFKLECSKCSSQLGHLYNTTSPQLDHIRGAFCLSNNVLKRYKIGGEDGEEEEEEEDDDDDDVGAVSHHGKSCEKELNKVKEVLMIQEERILGLERRLQKQGCVDD